MLKSVTDCANSQSARSHKFSAFLKARGFFLALSASTLSLSPCHALHPALWSSAGDEPMLQSHFSRQASPKESTQTTRTHTEGPSRSLDIKVTLFLATLHPQVCKITLQFGSQSQSVRQLISFLNHKCRTVDDTLTSEYLMTMYSTLHQSRREEYSDTDIWNPPPLWNKKEASFSTHPLSFCFDVLYLNFNSLCSL